MWHHGVQQLPLIPRLLMTTTITAATFPAAMICEGTGRSKHALLYPTKSRWISTLCKTCPWAIPPYRLHHSNTLLRLHPRALPPPFQLPSQGHLSPSMATTKVTTLTLPTIIIISTIIIATMDVLIA
ncbi:hypothetical protein BDB00DRAFT_617865 [Zychaea mexicana]|uniref:uncharacterized protein n=1 Tax=Zychaea mexicana TaxID=64656 RepID=UPI0022FE5205|nr:uncharacterized protein BDB00DRAFT_617865 [Zychaea mexicana]KAI9489423.1 hypothetical protein BDB00DRAFT_617865 [Zychaea mexicana]